MTFITLNQSSIDMTGQRYGRLVAIGPVGRVSKQRVVVWRFQCDCGNIVDARGANVRHGISTSCGCVHKQMVRDRSTKHGLRKTAEYGVWSRMRRRCQKTRDKEYKNYGGRGISVCTEWEGVNGFVTFLHDMGSKPSPAHSIERIDNNSGYYKENCKWATPAEQVRNRRCTRFIEHGGKKLTLQEFCNAYRLDYFLTHTRLFRLNWSADQAINGKTCRQAGYL